MAGNDLFERFPEMKPLGSGPSLFRLNGFGVGMYGARDRDEESGTYVKTHCVSALWVPLFAIGAYRVADADEGWYFIGKVPLSGVAKVVNILVLCAAAFAFVRAKWEDHTSTAEYRAEQLLELADDHAGAGRFEKAALLYARVARSKSDVAPRGADRFGDLLDRPAFHAAPPELVASVFGIASRLRTKAGGEQTFDDLAERARRAVAGRSGSDPRGALVVLDAVAAFGDLSAAREALLERLVAAEPDDAGAAAALAGLFDERGDRDRCEALLAPHDEALLGTDGARILGRIRASQERYDEAVPLLASYVAARLEEFHDSTRAFDRVAEGLWQQELGRLEAGNGPKEFYRAYDAAPEAEKRGIVSTHVLERLRANPDYRNAQERYERVAPLVPVVLDLGIARLRRSQGLADPKERRRELEAAEKDFLSVRGQASESDEYRLQLAQVYFWLDKQDEGEELLESLLKWPPPTPERLARVALAYRGVGATSRARELMEKAYDAEKDEAQRRDLASIRAAMSTDMEESITWLERSDPANPDVRANLLRWKAARAKRENRLEEAAGLLHQALEVYSRMPDSATVFNERGLASGDLFALTGDRKAFADAVSSHERSVELSGNLSILVNNTANILVEAAIYDLAGDAVDWSLLCRRPRDRTLGYLHGEAAGRAALRTRLLADRRVARALELQQRGAVLAPRAEGSYYQEYMLFDFAANEGALRALRDRLRAADLDTANARADTAAWLRGEKDESMREATRTGLLRNRERVERTRATGGATFALACSSLIRRMQDALLLGVEFEGDPVALAEEALRAHASAATRGGLVDALVARASRTLASDDAEYRRMAERARRSVGDHHLLAYALGGGDALAKRAHALPDVQRVLELLLEERTRFPGDDTPWQ